MENAEKLKAETAYFTQMTHPGVISPRSAEVLRPGASYCALVNNVVVGIVGGASGGSNPPVSDLVSEDRRAQNEFRVR